jgi:hypothetical protein
MDLTNPTKMELYHHQNPDITRIMLVQLLVSSIIKTMKIKEKALDICTSLI